jgi:hypothetical protein
MREFRDTPHVITDTVRQLNGLAGWKDDELRGGSVRATPLTVPYPDALAETIGYPLTDRVNLTAAIAARNDKRPRHCIAACAASRLPI